METFVVRVLRPGAEGRPDDGRLRGVVSHVGTDARERAFSDGDQLLVLLGAAGGAEPGPPAA